MTPMAEVTFGADTAAKETARTVLAQQTNIQVILSIVATTIAAASTTDTVDESAVTEQAATQIAALMTATPTAALVINSEASVTTILTNTATELVTSTPINATVIAAVSQQVETTAQLVVSNIKAVVVSGDNQATETGLDAIKEANAILSLITDEDAANSVANTIQEAVNTGVATEIVTEVAEITTLATTAENELDERPTVTPPSDTPPAVILTTGGEGGN